MIQRRYGETVAGRKGRETDLTIRFPAANVCADCEPCCHLSTRIPSMRKAFIATFMLCAVAPTTVVDYPTRVAMDALMNIRFYPNNGRFMLEPIPVLFPPDGGGHAKIVIRKAAGGVAVSMDAEIVPMVGYPAFGVLQAASGDPGMFGPIGAGDYIFAVELGGAEISAYPFKMTLEEGSDPFNPSKAMVRTGPWSKAAFLINTLERPGEAVNLGMWVSTRDMPGYAPNKQIPWSLHLMIGGVQVASVDGQVTDPDWTFFHMDLRHKSAQASSGPFTWANLTAKPGRYTLEFRSGARVLRSYQFQVAGGTVNRIATNQLGYEGTDALPPQSIMTISGTTQRVEQFWLAPLN